jgi:hypothetical protein
VRCCRSSDSGLQGGLQGGSQPKSCVHTHFRLFDLKLVLCCTFVCFSGHVVNFATVVFGYQGTYTVDCARKILRDHREHFRPCLSTRFQYPFPIPLSLLSSLDTREFPLLERLSWPPSHLRQMIRLPIVRSGLFLGNRRPSAARHFGAQEML